MERDDVDEIICATDAGREGECIFRYVYNKTGCQKPVKRLWTSSLEEKAIKKAFSEMTLSTQSCPPVWLMSFQKAADCPWYL